MGKQKKRRPPVSLETLTPGDGMTAPKAGDAVTVHYDGTLASDGTLFDSSRLKKTPFSFKLGGGRVIKGWDVGVSQMTLNQRAKLTIASRAAYGAAGRTGQDSISGTMTSGTGFIPPDSDLVFEVELLDINFAAMLERYRATLDEWRDAKLRAYDEADAPARAQFDAKHTSRAGYEAHLKGVAARKWDAERSKRFAELDVQMPPVEVPVDAPVEAAAAGLASATLQGRERLVDVSEQPPHQQPPHQQPPPPPTQPPPQPELAPQLQQIERRSRLSHTEFAKKYRHQRPVILAGLASEWPALSRWQDSSHLRTLLDKDVLVLRSKNGRVFLKRDCEHFDGPFANVSDML